MKFSVLLPVLTLTSTVFALPAPSEYQSSSIETRAQACAATCGKVCYYQSTLDNAVSDGYELYQDKQEKGDYPHTYNNYEGFDFPVSGPYQEYPVLSTFKAYTGSSPGADRVIFNTKGSFAGAITHTGASGNNFVACT